MLSTVSLFILLLNIFSAQSLGEKCDKTEDCKIPNTICLSGKCSCNKFTTQVKLQCLLYAITYKGYCESNEQCEWIGANAGCIKGKCQCEENYRWYQGKCQRFARKGEKCEEGRDCYSGFDYLSLKCENNTCVCSDGYYDRGPDCRRISKEGLGCAINLDCRNDTLICKGAKCVEKANFHEERTVQSVKLNLLKSPKKHGKILQISCDFDDDCKAIDNSQCDVANRHCTCLPETYLSQNRCLPGIRPCNADTDCMDVKNAMCFKETSCVCKQGYYLEDGECYPELGMPDPSLENEGMCKIRPKYFANHTCYCQNYWFNDDSNQNCIKTTAEQFNNCPDGSDSCNAMGLYSYCDFSTHKCSCLEPYYQLNKTTYLCDKQKDLPKDSCLRDNDCNLNEQCYKGRCECIEMFTRDDNGTCLPDIGGSCEVSSCSHIGNAKCAGGICACYTNMSYVDQIKKCVKVVHHLNEECEYTEQCIYLKNTVCNVPHGTNDTVKKCICGLDYLQINEDCLREKRYGDPCMTSEDCTLVLNDSFECRKSMCQCPTDYEYQDDYCERSGSLQLIAGYGTIMFCAWIAVIVFF